MTYASQIRWFDKEMNKNEEEEEKELLKVKS